MKVQHLLKNTTLICLGILTLNAGCRRDDDDTNLPYDPNGTEFNLGYNNAAVKVKTFTPPISIKAIVNAPSGEASYDLDVDNDSIIDFVFSANYGNIQNGRFVFSGLEIRSTNGLYGFQNGPIAFDTIFKCLDGTSPFLYNLLSSYTCTLDSVAGLNIIKQPLFQSFGDAPINGNNDPNIGWDYQGIPLSQYSEGFSDALQCNFRYENFPVPDNLALYIPIQNRLLEKRGWLHLKIINHQEIILYDYGLEKLL
jgi:hypothetical protein